MALNNTRGQIRILNSQINVNLDELTGSEAAQVSALSRASERKEVFRTDLMMFAEGDLFVNGRPYQAKDLDLVSGVYNYAQAITHRLMTTRGTMPGDRFFGVPWNDYLGVPYQNRDTIKRLMITDITEELYKDSRTGQVISVVPEFQSPTEVTVTCTVFPVRISSSLEVSVVVGETA